ncbi:hypothetical protein MJO10_31070, partial [Salmonella enterica subsp. enterica serovar Anatum]|nr:hypothetical protein [Salmonella enterica subsp. enterica serovar Anatum]
HSILEQIIIQADKILRQSMSDKECDRYLELTLEPLRSNDGQDSRFTHEKRQQTHSPYQHLLPPKAAGIAMAINVLGSQFDKLLN